VKSGRDRDALGQTGLDRQCDRVLVVDTPESMQIRRLQARDGSDEAEARAILERQSSHWTRLQRADDVIDNSDEVPPDVGIEPQVRALDRKYRLLSSATP
jgi:dephospho-CoA kinase